MARLSTDFQRQSEARRAREVPWQLLAGLLLIATWWTVAWGQPGWISDYYFFPLWLGYYFTVDGLVAVRTGTSPLRRSGWRVAYFFILSAPFWWIFELINVRLDNWHYVAPWELHSAPGSLIGTLSFSTVIPAILTTAELVASFRLGAPGWLGTLELNRTRIVQLHLSGWVMLALMLAWPKYFFPFCWLSVFFILDPIARLLGGRSIAWFVQRGDWTPVFNLGIAGLICGWFWEMWNYYSMPKWFYTVPHVDFLKVWEMPILGYGGYIPFALEIFSLYILVGALAPALSLPGVRVASKEQIDRPVSGHL